MIYALVNKDGFYVIRYGLEGLDQEDLECLRWELDREPNSEETVDPTTGKIILHLEKIYTDLVSEIKSEAGRRILEAVPYFKQINDLKNPEGEGVKERNELIDSIRKWSNDLEEDLKKAKTSESIAAIRKNIAGKD